jgi:hypothetical protein
MKKSIALGTMLLLATGAFAQKAKIRDAKDYANDKDYKKAMASINEAVNNEDTKNNADAWYTRGLIYLAQAADSTSKVPNAADESLNSFMKALTLKPDYGPEMNLALLQIGNIFFNQGIDAYKNDPALAYEKFMKVVSIYNVQGGKRFSGDKNLTEVAMTAKSNAAYSAMNAKKDDEAIAVLNDMKTTSKDTSVYQALIEIYDRQKNNDKLLETINEARTKFPNNQTFRNQELNYYINSGQSDVLIRKLEDAVKNDPNNALLQYNLATTYRKAALPVNEKNVPQPRPANSAEMFSKSEAAFGKALAVEPNNVDYNYDFGVLYYMAATELNQQANNVTGTSPEENKKHDALIAQRNAQFDKAVPLMEKVYQTLSPKVSSLSSGDKVTYQNTLIVLHQIYSLRGNKAKTDELKGKMDALK